VLDTALNILRGLALKTVNSFSNLNAVFSLLLNFVIRSYDFYGQKVNRDSSTSVNQASSCVCEWDSFDITNIGFVFSLQFAIGLK
jgi:hypothetical protein